MRRHKLAYLQISIMRRDVFNAIADPTRRSILTLIMTEAKNVNALADSFEMSRQAVSLHLKYLQECGVISIQKEGRERFCNLEVDKLHEVAEWLEPFRQLWEGRFQQLDDLLGDIQGKNMQ